MHGRDFEQEIQQIQGNTIFFGDQIVEMFYWCLEEIMQLQKHVQKLGNCHLTMVKSLHHLLSCLDLAGQYLSSMHSEKHRQNLQWKIIQIHM